MLFYWNVLKIFVNVLYKYKYIMITKTIYNDYIFWVVKLFWLSNGSNEDKTWSNSVLYCFFFYQRANEVNIFFFYDFFVLIFLRKDVWNSWICSRNKDCTLVFYSIHIKFDRFIFFTFVFRFFFRKASQLILILIKIQYSSKSIFIYVIKLARVG